MGSLVGFGGPLAGLVFGGRWGDVCVGAAKLTDSHRQLRGVVVSGR